MRQLYILPDEIKEELLTMLDLDLENIETGVSTETGAKFIIGMFSYLDGSSYNVDLYNIDELDQFILKPKLSFEEYCDEIKEELETRDYVCTPFFFGQLSSIWNYWAGHESYVPKAEKVYRGKPLLYFVKRDYLTATISQKDNMIMRTSQAYESMLASSVSWRSVLPILRNIR